LLFNLGNLLNLKHGSKGIIDNLEDALQFIQDAVGTVPEDYIDGELYISSHGRASLARFIRTGAKADLDDAVRMQGEAVNATPEDLPSRAKYLRNLGTTLEQRYGRAEKIEDLEQAIKVQQQALDIASQPDLNPEFLHNLTQQTTFIG
jgi:tetratricopeptide (TPR) repeat protein